MLTVTSNLSSTTNTFSTLPSAIAFNNKWTSVVSKAPFSFKSNVALNVATLIVAMAYAIFQFAYLYLRKSLMSKEYKVVVCFLIPIFYLLLATFTLIVLFAKANVQLDSNFDTNIVDVLFVLVYLSPSFHLLLLLMAGLSYA